MGRPTSTWPTRRPAASRRGVTLKSTGTGAWPSPPRSAARSSSSITVPASLAPGLLLGRYTDANQAQAALTRLQQRGVRTARVQTLVAPSAEHRLRIERAEPAALGLLAPEIKPAWRRCG